MDDWNSPKMLGREENLAILLNSWMVPCPGGHNAETFRVYEAMQAGAIPILTKEPGMELYLEYLGRWLPLLIAENWQHATQIVNILRQNPEIYEQYRTTLLDAWEKMKNDLQTKARAVYGV
jgi:hypothetical protein